MKRTLTHLFAALLCALPAAADESETVISETVTEVSYPVQNAKNKTDVIDNPVKWRFSWGADIGGSIDMCAKDMSSIDLSVSLGASYKWINFLGVSLGADFMVSNSCRSFPLALQFRTNFRSRPSIVFWEIRGGLSLNYIEHNHQQTGAYGSTGIGFYLARSNKFSSHLLLSYTLLERHKYVGEERTHSLHDIHYASVSIGVSF